MDPITSPGSGDQGSRSDQATAPPQNGQALPDSKAAIMSKWDEVISRETVMTVAFGFQAAQPQDHRAPNFNSPQEDSLPRLGQPVAAAPIYPRASSVVTKKNTSSFNLESFASPRPAEPMLNARRASMAPMNTAAHPGVPIPARRFNQAADRAHPSGTGFWAPSEINDTLWGSSTPRGREVATSSQVPNLNSPQESLAPIEQYGKATKKKRGRPGKAQHEGSRDREQERRLTAIHFYTLRRLAHRRQGSFP